MSSSNVDDGTLVTSVATVVLTSLLNCAADSKSGRRDNASAMTLSLPGLYSTENLHPAKKDSHLAIICERCGMFTAVRNDYKRPISKDIGAKLCQRIRYGKEFLFMH